jgi:hypothetical protein
VTRDLLRSLEYVVDIRKVAPGSVRLAMQTYLRSEIQDHRLAGPYGPDLPLGSLSSVLLSAVAKAVSLPRCLHRPPRRSLDWPSSVSEADGVVGEQDAQ